MEVGYFFKKNFRLFLIEVGGVFNFLTSSDGGGVVFFNLLTFSDGGGWWFSIF